MRIPLSLLIPGAALLAAFAALFTVTPASTAAVVQRAPGQGATAAVLLRVPQLSNTAARAQVIRRHSTKGTVNMILVTDATTPRDLARAASVLANAGGRSTLTPGTEHRTWVSAAPPPRAEKPTRNEVRAVRDLARVRGGKWVNVPGVGEAQALRVTVRTGAPGGR